MRSFISIQLFLIVSFVLLLNIDESVAPESGDGSDGGFNAGDPSDHGFAPEAVVGRWKPDGKDSIVERKTGDGNQTANEQYDYGRVHARVESEGRVFPRKPADNVNARQPKQVEPNDDDDGILRERDPTARNEVPNHAKATKASENRETATREARVPKAAPKPAKIAAVDPNANFLKKTAASEGKASVRAAGRKVPAKENADA